MALCRLRVLVGFFVYIVACIMSQPGQQLLDFCYSIAIDNFNIF